MKGLGKKLRILTVCLLSLCLLTVTAWAAPVEGCSGDCAHQAAIDAVHYDTLAEALDAATSSCTVTLLTDISLTEPVNVSVPLILDLNGKTVTAALSSPEQAALHFTAVGILKGGKVTAENGSAVLVTDTTVQIEKDVILEGTAPVLRLEASDEKLTQVKLYGSVAAKGSAPAISAASEKGACELYVLEGAAVTSEDVGIFFDAAGKLSVEDGTVTAKKDALSVVLKTDRKTELSITGGKITSAEGQVIAMTPEEGAEVPKDFVTGGTFDKAPSDYIPSHSQVQENTDGSFTVVSAYTISFLPGSGSGTMASVTVPCGSAVTLPKCEFSASGMDFAGWQIGNSTYAPGSSYTPTGNTAATALWIAHVHTGGSATCLRKATCSTCGASYGELVGHSMIQTEEVSPTCTETGMRAHTECRFCGDVFVDGTVVSADSMILPALGHDWETVAEVPATCQKDGTKEYRKCKVCEIMQLDGAELTDAEELILPQTGHKLEDVEAAPATCVNAGVMAHQYCIHCNGLFLNDAPVKASELTTTTTSHVLSDWFTDERDHWKNCVDCGVVFLQNVHTDMDFDLFCDECGYELTPEETANDHAGFSPLAFIPLVAAVAIAIGGVLIVLKKKTK